MRAKAYREQLVQSFAHILEEKQLDWKKEWTGKAIPLNGITGKSYRGLNRFYLTLIAMQREYIDSRWATFNQIRGKGWSLKNAKGQGVKVEYWYPYDTELKKNMTWEEFRASEEFGDRYQLRARYAVVFNGDLIEGIPPLPEREEKQIMTDELIHTLAKNMDVEIQNDGGDQAFYRIRDDSIHLPLPEVFDSEYAYNSTALHELTHATGAENRLNRDIGGGFGTETYAFEELVAEISSCFMSAYLKIEQNESHINNHKAYVQSWIKTIRDKPEELMRAIQLAEKASAYMESKANLITLEEYRKTQESSKTVEEKVIHVPDPVKSDKTLLQAISDTREGLEKMQEETGLLQSIICIRRYEQQTGKPESSLTTMDEKELREYGKKCKEYLEQSQKMENALQDRLLKKTADFGGGDPVTKLKSGEVKMPELGMPRIRS